MNDLTTPTRPRKVSVPELIFRVVGCLVMLVLGGLWVLLGLSLWRDADALTLVLCGLPAFINGSAALILANTKSTKTLILGGVLASASIGFSLYLIWAFLNSSH
jgi:hypothetical protein